MFAWDVVNEAVNPDGKAHDGIMYRDTSLWFRRLGPTVYDSAFWWAHRADSTAALFYNDHSIERSPAWGTSIYHFVAGLKRRQVPITGVGLQFHLRISSVLDTIRIREDVERLAALDLDIHITELDVLIGHSPASADELTRQAHLYRTVLRLCLAVPKCTAFSMWGFTDRRQSRSGVTWEDDPLIFDREYRRKPAYIGLWAELNTGR
jgi:endo-1,4-beta-xylanase